MFENLFDSIRATPEKHRGTIFLSISAYLAGVRDGERYDGIPKQKRNLYFPAATNPEEVEWLQRAARIAYAHGWKPIVRRGRVDVVVPLIGDADAEYSRYQKDVEKIRNFWGV